MTFEEWARIWDGGLFRNHDRRDYAKHVAGIAWNYAKHVAGIAWNARQPEIDALRERERKLREYSAHKPDCDWVKHGNCTCGLAELLAAKESE